MQRDTPDKTDVIDNSAAAVKRLLHELAELTGEADASVPVLELQFDDIVVRTSLTMHNAAYFLTIVALLPRSEQLDYHARDIEKLAELAPDAAQTDVLWHADDGHYVVMRNIPIQHFPDEASVLDAILDTSDHVREWFAALSASKPRPH